MKKKNYADKIARPKKSGFFVSFWFVQKSVAIPLKSKYGQGVQKNVLFQLK
jgi:hypothetical protein